MKSKKKNQQDTQNKKTEYIYERNPDTNEVYRRIKGDYDNRVKISWPQINSDIDFLIKNKK